MFKKSRDFHSLSSDEKNTVWLVDEIDRKAQGVFLWVYIVIRSLRRGLANEDTANDLQKRLAEIPSDLGDYIQLMLDRIEPIYQEEASKILLAMAAARSPLTAMTLSFCQEKDPMFAFGETFRALKESTLRTRPETMRKRIKARCPDLIEIEETPRSVERLHISGMKGVTMLVEFIHRSVRDYLSSAEITKILAVRASATAPFQPKKYICQALAVEVLLIVPNVLSSEGTASIVLKPLMMAAKDLEETNDETPIALLNHTLTNFLTWHKVHQHPDIRQRMLLIAADFELILYMKHLLDSSPALRITAAPELYHHVWFNRSLAVLQFLLTKRIGVGQTRWAGVAHDTLHEHICNHLSYSAYMSGDIPNFLKEAIPMCSDHGVGLNNESANLLRGNHFFEPSDVDEWQGIRYPGGRAAAAALPNKSLKRSHSPTERAARPKRVVIEID